MGLYDPYLAEIVIVAHSTMSFQMAGWLRCDGQLLPISGYTALYSLLGTTYGGDGVETFALPDLRGRAPMHPGQGPGLSLHELGESGGTASVTLDVSQIPTHTHTVVPHLPVGQAASTDNPVNAYFAPTAQPAYSSVADSEITVESQLQASPVGSDAAHNNMQPYLSQVFLISVAGEFPPRP